MEMRDALTALATKIREDYVRFTEAAGRGTPEPGTYFYEQLETFDDNLEFKEGKKYIKVLRESAVWGFIVNVENDPKFTYGDILMANSYTTPARNKPRGNVFGEYRAPWTGAEYL